MVDILELNLFSEDVYAFAVYVFLAWGIKALSF